MERTALVRFALHPEATAHQGDQPRRDGQPQAGAAILAGRRAIGLLEGVEDRLLSIRRNADARIAHGEMQLCPWSVVRRPLPILRAFLSAVRLPLQRATDHGPRTTNNVQNHLAGPGELDGVADEVDDDLTQAYRIAHQDVGDVGGKVAGEFEALGMAAFRQRLSVSPRVSRNEKGRGSSSSLPASILEKSRMSLMTVNSDSADDFTNLR